MVNGIDSNARVPIEIIFKASAEAILPVPTKLLPRWKPKNRLAGRVAGRGSLRRSPM